MTVEFGNKNVIIEGGKTKEGEWVCRFQRISKEADNRLLKNDEWKKYIDDSPCIFKFKDIKSLDEVRSMLSYLRRMMVQEIIESLEDGVEDGQI